MQLFSIDSATKTATDGVLVLSLTADIDDGKGTQSGIPYGWHVDLRDPHGLYPQVDEWMAAHPDFPIGDYVPPAPSTDPNDYQLKRYQFEAICDIAGLTPLVEPALNSITDPVQRAVARGKYNTTEVFQRNDPTLLLLCAAAGLTAAQVDAYWMQAKDL